MVFNEGLFLIFSQSIKAVKKPRKYKRPASGTILDIQLEEMYTGSGSAGGMKIPIKPLYAAVSRARRPLEPAREVNLKQYDVPDSELWR